MLDDPSALVVPFGKHKGKTVAELLATDPPYADWLVAQGWLADRFAALHQAIITRGAAHEDTPEHNTLQARFLDRAFQVAFLFTANRRGLDEQRNECINHIKADRNWRVKQAADHVKNLSYSWKDRIDGIQDQRLKAQTELDFAEAELSASIHISCAIDISFEQNGVDVVLVSQFIALRNCSSRDNTYNIELKPDIGDDFPAVMRQLQRLDARSLVIERYTGRSVSFDALRSMFTANKQRLITLQEIQAELPEAHTFVDAYCS